MHQREEKYGEETLDKRHNSERNMVVAEVAAGPTVGRTATTTLSIMIKVIQRLTEETVGVRRVGNTRTSRELKSLKGFVPSASG